MANISIHSLISGRVQGVWYRASTVEKAKALGLRGWVKNLSDGRVECLACGDEADVKALCDWFWQGSPLSKVTDVTCEEVVWQDFDDFKQIRS